MIYVIVLSLSPIGGLSIIENDRRVVSAEVWNKLRMYFPKVPEFPQNHESCQQCMVINESISTTLMGKRCSRLLPIEHFWAEFLTIDRVFQRLEREGKENEALNRMMANEQKSSLLNLFQEKNRPTLQKWPQVMPFYKIKDSFQFFSLMLER